jgi:SET domain-containing protein
MLAGLKVVETKIRPSAAPFEIRSSPIHGLGAFATRHIASGTRLIEYAGERLTPTVADERYPDFPDAVIDDGRIWIETIRDVMPGEELAYDYGLILEQRHTPAAKRQYACRCGTKACRGTMLARKR